MYFDPTASNAAAFAVVREALLDLRKLGPFKGKVALKKWPRRRRHVGAKHWSHSPRPVRLAVERSTFSPSQLRAALWVDCQRVLGLKWIESAAKIAVSITTLDFERIDDATRLTVTVVALSQRERYAALKATKK